MQREIVEKSSSLNWIIPELNKKKDYFSLKNYKIKTIYFGGGTPSLISEKDLEQILITIKTNLNVQKDVEISIECNPESLDLKKIIYYQKIGITRISLGIQSFDKKTLYRIARPHDAKTIFKALEALKQSGFKNYGTDFIIGLPHQTLRNFKDQLRQIIDLNIPHLSFYFLSYDTNRIDLFKGDCPNDDIQIQMYEHLTKSLKKEGYLHYEVSNYAKPGFECRHNLRYWNQQEYIGFGLGAHSYFHSKCFENERNFDLYLKNPLLIEEKIEIDPELHHLEYIMLHLRTVQGISKKDYQRSFKDFQTLLKKALTFIESGHLIYDNKNLYASEKGFLILDKITRDLL